MNANASVLFARKYEQVCNDSLLVRNIESSFINVVARKYLFMVFFCLGIGNLLNLLVLNSSALKKKTSIYLSCLALVDLLFFLCRLPQSLAFYEAMDRSYGFRVFYSDTRVLFIGLANWMSAASIWFALAVTVERVVAVCRPMQVKSAGEDRRVSISSIAGIFASTFSLTMYRYFQYSSKACNNLALPKKYFYSATLDYDMSGNSSSAFVLSAYLQASNVLGITLIFAVPLVAMVLLNCSLVYYLRKSSKNMVLICRHSNPYRVISQERKVTFMVCLIVGSFVSLNLPSAAIMLMKQMGIYQRLQAAVSGRTHKHIVIISNSLIELSKCINIFLYFIASANFRKKICETLAFGIRRVFRKKIVEDRRSSAGSTSLNSVKLIRKETTTDRDAERRYIFLNETLRERETNL